MPTPVPVPEISGQTRKGVQGDKASAANRAQGPLSAGAAGAVLMRERERERERERPPGGDRQERGQKGVKAPAEKQPSEVPRPQRHCQFDRNLSTPVKRPVLQSPAAKDDDDTTSIESGAIFRGGGKGFLDAHLKAVIRPGAGSGEGYGPVTEPATGQVTGPASAPVTGPELRSPSVSSRLPLTAAREQSRMVMESRRRLMEQQREQRWPGIVILRRDNVGANSGSEALSDGANILGRVNVGAICRSEPTAGAGGILYRRIKATENKQQFQRQSQP